MLSEYEQLRLANIERNNKFLASLFQDTDEHFSNQDLIAAKFVFFVSHSYINYKLNACQVLQYERW